MISQWELPREAVIGGRHYALHTDFRDILEIFSYLEDPELPQYLRWQIALALFFEGEIPPEDQQAALSYLLKFLNGGEEEKSRPGPKLLDWQQDAGMIVADINKTAGQEIRALPFVHWWTFLSWFHAIGEGQLSTVVAIRQKLRRGKPLEKWEKDFYRENKETVDIQRRYSAAELEEQERLKKILDRD